MLVSLFLPFVENGLSLGMVPIASICAKCCNPGLLTNVFILGLLVYKSDDKKPEQLLCNCKTFLNSVGCTQAKQ